MKWWQYLDWSTMQRTFRRLSPKLKELVLKEGYWSLGQGEFQKMIK